MNDIINEQLDRDVKYLYRIVSDGRKNQLTISEVSQHSERSILVSEVPSFTESSYFIIKVKRQMWYGMPAIAIFISDVTKKIVSHVNEKKVEEEREKAKQAENFTQTVSHEMRTPIGNCLVFINSIMDIFSVLFANNDIEDDKVRSAKQYLMLIESQL